MQPSPTHVMIMMPIRHAIQSDDCDMCSIIEFVEHMQEKNQQHQQCERS